MKNKIHTTILLFLLSSIMVAQTIKVNEKTISFFEDNYLELFEVKEQTIFEYTNQKRISKIEKDLESNKLTYKRILDDYNERFFYADSKNKKLTGVISDLKKYSESSEKHKNKKHILENNQRVLDSMRIRLIYTKIYPQTSTTMEQKEKRYVYIDDGYKKSEKEINILIGEIQKEIDNINYPSKPMFLTMEKELDSLKQYKTQRKTFVINNKTSDIKKSLQNSEIVIISEDFRPSNTIIYDSNDVQLIEGVKQEYSYQNNPNKRPLVSVGDKLYYIRNNKIIDDYNSYLDEQEMVYFVESLGYKTYKLDPLYSEYYYFDSKNARIKIGDWLKDEYKENKNIINDLDKDLVQFKKLLGEAKTHQQKLENYFRLYRLQRNKMSTSDINKWVEVTKQAEIHYQKINNIVTKNEYIPYNMLDVTYENEYTEFQNYVLTAKVHLNI